MMGIYALSSSCSSWTLATSCVYPVTSLDRQCIYLHPLCITSVSVRIVLVLSKINSHVVNYHRTVAASTVLGCSNVHLSQPLPFFVRPFVRRLVRWFLKFLHPSIPASVCLGVCVHLSGQLPVRRSVNSIHSSIPVIYLYTLVSQTSVDPFVCMSSWTIVSLFLHLLVGFL